MKFYKYCASGNDFVIFKTDKKENRSNLAKILCNRYSGIGADGMIAILDHDEFDFEWEFYNCDGSEASMCGNGARAAAHFFHHFFHHKENISFLTKAGIIKANIKNDKVRICFGKIKYIKEVFKFKDRLWQECNSGVPHLVTFCDDLNEFDLELCKSLRNKYNANVNYVKIDKDGLKVRTYERGVEDETLACGTGMAACFYIANLNEKIQNKSKVFPKSNEELEFEILDDDIYFTGKVRYCFEANFNFN